MKANVPILRTRIPTTAEITNSYLSRRLDNCLKQGKRPIEIYLSEQHVVSFYHYVPASLENLVRVGNYATRGVPIKKSQDYTAYITYKKL